MTTQTPDIFDAIREAEAERDQAFTHLDASDANDENALLREQILALGSRLSEFSANAFRALLDDGLIEVVGFVKSSNRRTHGHRVLSYKRVAS